MLEQDISAFMLVYWRTIASGKDKSDCTDEAINAVRDFMVDDLLGGIDCSKRNKSGYTWKLKDGRSVTLEVRIEE